MAFHEVRLPIEIERGASGGPGFLTTVSVLRSGKEQRNALWEIDRGRWDIGYGIQTREDALIVRDFFYARMGRLHGFRFRDWTNYQTEGTAKAPAGLSTVDTGEPAEADGTTKTFQLYYTYTDSGAYSYTKKIHKPQAGTIRVYIDGLEVDETDTTGGWNLDSTTGIITFQNPPEYNSIIEWTGKFDLPVRFDTDQLEMVVTTKELITQPNIPLVELKL